MYNCYVFARSGIFPEHHDWTLWLHLDTVHELRIAFLEQNILKLLKRFKFLKLVCSEYILMILCITVVDYSITLFQKELKKKMFQFS